MKLINVLEMFSSSDKKSSIFRLDKLYTDVEAMNEIIESFAEYCDNYKPDYLVAIESKGYLFASSLAYKLGLPIILVRKKRDKLKKNNEVREISVHYENEYAYDEIVMIKRPEYKGKKILIIDDVCSTGGTINAVVDLLNQCDVAKINSLVMISMMGEDAPNVNEYSYLFKI